MALIPKKKRKNTYRFELRPSYGAMFTGFLVYNEIEKKFYEKHFKDA
jgi:hypothetical protein